MGCLQSKKVQPQKIRRVLVDRRGSLSLSPIIPRRGDYSTKSKRQQYSKLDGGDDQALTKQELEKMNSWFKDGLRAQMNEMGKQEADKHKIMTELIADIIHHSEGSAYDQEDMLSNVQNIIDFKSAELISKMHQRVHEQLETKEIWEEQLQTIKTALTLDIVLGEPLILRSFTEFAAKEHTVENILFLLELRELDTIPFRNDPSYFYSRLRKVYKMYVHHLGLQQVNLPAQMRGTIDEAFEAYSSKKETNTLAQVAVDAEVPLPEAVFNDARREITKLVQHNSFHRFLIHEGIDAAIDNQIQAYRERQRALERQNNTVLKQKNTHQQTFSRVFGELTAKNLSMIGDDGVYAEARRRETLDQTALSNEKLLKKIGQEDVEQHQKQATIQKLHLEEQQQMDAILPQKVLTQMPMT